MKRRLQRFDPRAEILMFGNCSAVGPITGVDEDGAFEARRSRELVAVVVVRVGDVSDDDGERGRRRRRRSRRLNRQIQRGTTARNGHFLK